MTANIQLEHHHEEGDIVQLEIDTDFKVYQVIGTDTPFMVLRVTGKVSGDDPDEDGNSYIVSRAGISDLIYLRAIIDAFLIENKH